MSYFSADERLERGQTLPPAPYNLRLVELDERSAEVCLAWQRPLGRVEGYLIVSSSEFLVSGYKNEDTSGLDSSNSTKGNQTRNQELETRNFLILLRVVGREKCGARVRLPPEIWGANPLELAVVSYVGDVLSELSTPLVLPPRLRTKLEVRSQKSEVVEPVALSQMQQTSNNPDVVGDSEGSGARGRGLENETVGASSTRDNPLPNQPIAGASSTTNNAEAQPASTEPAPELAGWAEIEEALRRNSALLGRHGLFVNRNK
jgi:hypothetical protein